MVIYAYFSQLTVQSVLWTTPQIKDLMRNRDYHKKRAIKYSSQPHWDSFRPKHSTVMALIQMCDEWLENMEMGN